MTSIVFTKAEIRDFMEEQGFDVENEENLNNFIKDLKKLVKHEEMKKRRYRLGHGAEETVLDTTEESSYAAETTGSSYNGTSSQSSNPSSRRKSPRKSPERSYYSKSPDRSHYTKSPQRSYPKSSGRNSAQSDGRRSKKSPERHYQQSVSPSTSRSSKTNYKESEKDRGMERKDVFDGKAPFSDSTKESSHSSSRMNKNKNNRMIMKRVTAETDETGGTILQESDVDLGPRKREDRTSNQRRPKTAPTHIRRPFAPKTIKDYYKANPSASPKSPRSSRGDSAKSSNPLSRCGSGPQRCGSMEPDELFFVLRELMFPDDENSSEDSSLFSEEMKRKKLPKPPPHIAIDPVSLYHWYKKYHWDVHSIPGEDRHMKLRWNVRAKTIGGPHPCNYK